ncbi:hypothetical protein [Streptomyces sp. NBC_00648]|uniref:hypothetical protein n=1 Tax=Streptomyces sp. NBC_00648 TaxID=2975797 RepID=UPI003245281C
MADLDSTGAPRPARAAEVLRWTGCTEVESAECREAALVAVGPGRELEVAGAAPGSDGGTEGAGEAAGPAGPAAGRAVERCTGVAAWPGGTAGMPEYGAVPDVDGPGAVGARRAGAGAGV